MINLLIDNIEKAVSNRIKIDFNTDFRYSIMFETLMQDSNVPKKLKLVQAINYYYPHPEQISDYNKAVNDILWFYRCGKEEEELTNSKVKENKKQIYSYEFDNQYIFDAFFQEYNIDLQQIKYLHWWKFRAMFEGLCKSKICDIMNYRSIDTSKIKDSKERKRILKLQKLYKIPDMRSDEEKEIEFADALWQ